MAGDIDVDSENDGENYFGPIPRGNEIENKRRPITEPMREKAYDANIQIPAVLAAYRTPSFKEEILCIRNDFNLFK